MSQSLIQRYVLYADEAYTSAAGLRYHQFFGGALVLEQFIPHLEATLDRAAGQEGTTWELKWQKVDQLRLNAYLRFMQAFFDELAKGYFRVRVMYLDKFLEPTGITPEQRETAFQRLYYTFIAKAFGWPLAPMSAADEIVLRIFFHHLPDKHEKNAALKTFVRGIPNTRVMRHVRLTIPQDGIAEVASKPHRILQAVDTLIGAIGFRLNGRHLVKQANGRRGNRTRAKEQLYKYIALRLRSLGVANIGITTGKPLGQQSLWSDAIRLWRLEPTAFRRNDSWTKKGRKKK